MRRGLASLLFLGLSGCATSNTINAEESFFPFSSSSGQNVVYSAKVINSFIHIFEGRINEIPLCLIGEEREKSYFVSDITVPYINSADSLTANYSQCSEGRWRVEGYLGLAHNHSLSGNCLPSLIDMERFLEKEKETAKIEVIVCGVNFPYGLEFSTYIKSNLPENFLDLYDDFLKEQYHHVSEDIN